MALVRVNWDEETTARAYDRAMKERQKETHTFKPMDVRGMETVCDYCCSTHN